jgi:hypothetical protein
VRDSKTNDVFIKLVNMLPVTVNMVIELNDIKKSVAKATKTVLSGNPSDKVVRPVVSEIMLTAGTAIELPAYSFTVLKIKTY